MQKFSHERIPPNDLTLGRIHIGAGVKEGQVNIW
jgi:hypothetical protein